MKLINETLVSVGIASTKVDDQYMECISNMQLWLRMHQEVVLVIEFNLIFFSLCIIILCSFVHILSPSFRLFISYVTKILPSYEYRGRYFYCVVLFVKEIVLASVYILLALFCKWSGLINNNSEITYMDFHRWFIETSFDLFFITHVMCMYFYRRLILDWTNEFQIAHDVVILIFEIPVFIIMRYAEHQPHCQVNMFKVDSVRRYCQSQFNKTTHVVFN